MCVYGWYSCSQDLPDECKIASSGPMCGDVYEGDDIDHEPVKESQSPKFIVCNYSYLI